VGRPASNTHFLIYCNSYSRANNDPNGLVAMEEETLCNEKPLTNEEEEVKPDEVVHEVAVGKDLVGALKILRRLYISCFRKGV
jgi:hypothetical protein